MYVYMIATKTPVVRDFRSVTSSHSHYLISMIMMRKYNIFFVLFYHSHFTAMLKFFCKNSSFPEEANMNEGTVT